MSRLLLRTKVLLGFAIPLGVLIVASAIVYRALTLSLSTAQDVAHASRVIASLNVLLNVVTDAESAERSFVITGDERLLQPYNSALANFKEITADLRTLIGGDRAQLSRMARLEESFRLWRSAAAEPEIHARHEAPVNMVAAARSAYTLLQQVWRLEAEYIAFRDPRDLQRWQRLVDQLRTQLADILKLERSPERATAWRRAMTIAADYEVVFVNASHRTESLASLRARAREQRQALDSLVTGMAESYEAEDTRLRKLIAASTGTALVGEIKREIHEFDQSERETLRSRATASELATRWSRLVVLVGPVVGMGAAMLVALVISLGIVRSVSAVARAAEGLAAGDLSLRAPVRRGDEVGVMAQAFNAMAERLATWTREVTLLSQMSDLLQACSTTEEAYAAIGKFAAELFPAEAGGVFMLSPSGNLAERVVIWGKDEQSDRWAVFTPEECWALRRGRVYLVEDTRSAVLCKHVGNPLPIAYTCIPLVAHGEALGVLYLQSQTGSKGAARLRDEGTQRLARTMAEQISLALANIRLRETLRRQSIRDPLTGLFNRRYMEETLERELRRGQRGGCPMGVIMGDLDHFKHFNDSFGHDAGDVLLRELGHLMQTTFRTEDIVCRYGGEEFALILPEASLEETHQRAEHLREAAKRLRVIHRGQVLGPVTLSLGVAAYPEHGAVGEALLRSADAALYRAKAEGRDRVKVAEGAGPRGLVQTG